MKGRMGINPILIIGLVIIGLALVLFKTKPAEGSDGGDGDGGGDVTLPSALLSPVKSATTAAELEAARADFEAAYSSGTITKAQYDKLFVQYTRRNYYLDLYNRGGSWVAKADAYWKATALLLTVGQIRSAYEAAFSGPPAKVPLPTRAQICAMTTLQQVDNATTLIGEQAANYTPAECTPLSVLLYARKLYISWKDWIADTPRGAENLARWTTACETFWARASDPGVTDTGTVVSLYNAFYAQGSYIPPLPEPGAMLIETQLASIMASLTRVWLQRGSTWYMFDPADRPNSYLTVLATGDHITIIVRATCSLAHNGQTSTLIPGSAGNYITW